MRLSFSSRSAFTFIEIMASIVIMGLLCAGMAFYIFNYKVSTQSSSDQKTLESLNNALDSYKIYGGNTRALTTGAPVRNILSLIKTGVTSQRLGLKFLSTGFTASGTSLDGVGTGSKYRFVRYNSYSDTSATTNYPYGVNVGYMANGGAQVYNVTIYSTTGYVAYMTPSGGPTIIAANWPTATSFPAAAWIKFWNCKSATDATKSGILYYLLCGSNQLTTLDLRGLTYLQQLDCSNNQLTTLKIDNVPLIYFQCQNNTQLSGVNFSNRNFIMCRADSTAISGAIDLSNCRSMTSCYFTSSQITSIDVSGCSALVNLYCSGAKLTSMNVTGCTALQYIYADGNFLSTLDPSTCTSLIFVRVGNSGYVAQSLISSIASLDALYNNLPTFASGTHNLYIGANSATGSTTSIATGKNWTVTRTP